MKFVVDLIEHSYPLFPLKQTLFIDGHVNILNFTMAHIIFQIFKFFCMEIFNEDVSIH